ncbi:glutactin [Drosophila rhopaloa]|uniref:Glutactin n=1 Tax=Drosophila rhopaloa TaxID=1041015 RepID=A0A6P4F2T6_DRORH|nr:glutactin [Drosophila rhopaloa]
MQPLLLVLALCVAQICALPQGSPNDYNDEIDNEDTNVPWQPEPLKPAPWQEEPQIQPPQVVEVQVPGIGNIAGVKAFRNTARRPVNAFLGLRYGQVGGGLARFQAARPVGFQGRINATVPSPNCAQFPELDRLRTAESRGENVDDCLTLDIYAPENANRLPVLVFVHGEMLFDGGAEEGQPDYILERDVLLVSINYRLAPFGFLSALSDELPGNVALSDLHLALEWLHRNLPYFGGDPGKVTLVGQAGGATLAHALSLSGRAKNLFQQLILQSGTALNPYLIDERPLETLDTFARLARCPPATPTARGLQPLYACIARLPTSQLVAAFEQLFEQNERFGLAHIGGFKLVVGDRLGYLPRPPAQLAANVSNALPMIVGATKDAGAFILSRVYDQIASLRSYNVSDYIDVVLRHTAPPSEHRFWKQFALREIFLTDQERSASPESVAEGLLELSNYILYRAPVINSIRHSYRSVPAYLYLFAYRGQHHRFFHLRNPLPFGVDASLSDDGVYLFPYPPESSHLNSADSAVSNSLVDKWVDFAVAGVPNQNSGGWPRASSEYGPFLRFSNSIPLLELDPHFGEGLNLPNLSGESFKPTINITYPSPTTTTTTTRRPHAYNRPSRPNQQPRTWNPSNPDYVKDQEAKQQQFIRDRAQRWKEQQQREQEDRERQRQQREQEERERQQREQEEQERQRQQREQEERERQREQREQEERERQRQQREQDEPERERQLLEEEERVRQQQELEREQQEREQEERYNQEREQQVQYEQEPQPVDNPEEHPYDGFPSYKEVEQQREWQEQQERERQEREQQEREQQEREQQERDQQERDRQERARQDRDQQERDRQDQEQREREQQEQDQQERERQEQEPQEPEDNPEDPSYDVHPSDPEPDRNYNEEQEREEQQREQLRREQQEQRDREDQLQREREQERERQDWVREDQPKDKPEDYPSYEEYLKAQEESNSERDRNYDEEQERERQQQEQLHQERHPHPEGNLPETHDSDPNYAEEEESDQQAGEDQVVNRNSYSDNEELERSQDEETDPDALNPADFENYEAYILAATKQQEERDEQYRLEDERIRAQQEEEYRLRLNRQRRNVIGPNRTGKTPSGYFRN